MKPLLIIQADDAAIHPAIDRGILMAFDAGALTSVGLLVSGAFAGELAAELEKRPGIGIGLHLALTRASATASTGIARAGEPLPASWAQFARRLAVGAISREDIGLEITEQVRRARALGLRVDHVDGHEHVHLMPGVADVIARICRDHDLPPRVRISRTPRTELARDPRAVALRAASSFTRRTAWRNFISPDRIVGIADMGGIRELSQILGQVRSGARSIELIVHPGDRPRPEEPELPPWDFDWSYELESLTITPWAQVLAKDYLLGTYRDL